MEKLSAIGRCKTLGESLQTLRKARKLTQEVLAERIEVDQSYIAQIETQGKIPSPETIIKILETLNVNSTDLMHIKMQYFQTQLKGLGDTVDIFKQLESKKHLDDKHSQLELKERYEKLISSIIEGNTDNSVNTSKEKRKIKSNKH